MKYAIPATGITAAGFFIYSVYVFAVEPEHFKSIAYGFLAFTILFFVLVIIRKVREDKALRRKLEASADEVHKKK